jgi:hypothetical protein
MADVEEHPTPIIGRGESVITKKTTTEDEETALDSDDEIALIKESQVRQYSKFIRASTSHTPFTFTQLSTFMCTYCRVGSSPR